MTVEGWKSVFDVGAVILLFLTFAAGLGVLITGNIINKRQQVQLRQFDKDLTAAKTELSEQQERAAKAERDLLELQERVKQRSVSPQQAKLLSAALRKVSGKGTVSIMCVMGDVEGSAFGVQIDGILKSAGWKSDGITLDGSFTPNSIEGLVIVRNKTVAQIKEAENLRRAFAAAGIAVGVKEKDDPVSEGLDLMVGNKH